MRFVDPRLLGRVRAVRRALALDVGAGVARTGLLLVQVSVLASVIAAVVDDRTVPSAAVVVVLLVVVVARAYLGVVVERYGREAAVATQSSLRAELVARRLRPEGGIQVPDAPGLAVDAVQGVDGLETYFGRYVPQVVLAMIVPPVVLVWTAVVDVESALILLLTLPLIPVFSWLIGRSTADRARANHRSLVTLSAHFLDLVRGLPTLRAFNRGPAQGPRLAETAEQYRWTTMRTLRLAFLSGTVLDLVTTFSIALVAVTLGVRLVDGGLALRPALTVLLLVPELYAPIRSVTALYHASADGLASAERILAVLEPVEPVAADAADAVAAAAPIEPGSLVEARAVTVRFAGRPEPALLDVDLVLRPGTVVALVGPSGSGKTTLGRTLLGLVRPDAGTVVTDEGPLLGDPDRWRTRVAWSAQRPAIVFGSVADNIALGRSDTPRDAVERAARAAGADAFVRTLPDGYDTVIGDGGRGLSSGQRQRIGLARALLRDADLLVLDEPTAHLDRDAAATVISALGARPREQAVLVLTHDLAVAASADRVLRIEGGRLADEALATGGGGRR